MTLFSSHIFLIAGLISILFLCCIFFWSEKLKQNKILKLTSTKLLPRLAPNYSKKRSLLKFGIFLFASLLLTLSLARPQWGSTIRTANPTGIDLIIALDVSKSMLARDVKPNRLERVKLSITNLIGNLKGDRVGLIAFAGNAFLQCPLTLDHQAFLNTLKHVEIGTIKSPGTNLAMPIEEAFRSFSQDDRDKFLILISDGEDLEGGGLKRAKEAKADGVKIFTIGIGSEEGVRIPMDPIGSTPRNFLLDPQGKTIITQMDESSLRSIAVETNGEYNRLGSTGQGLAHVFQKLKSIGEQKMREQYSSEIPTERFQPFLLLAIIFLLFEKLTPTAKATIKKSASLCLAVALCILGGCLKQDNIRRAEESASKGEWSIAAKFYEAELNASVDTEPKIMAKLLLNAGLAHSKSGNFISAKERLQEAIDQSIDSPDLQSKGLNELGNLFYKQTNEWLDQQNVAEARKTWVKAIDYYESAFQLDGNLKASSNLASLKKQIEERINSLVCVIRGVIWRDVNGDGSPQENEAKLPGMVFWDKDNNGEHNRSTEPFLETDPKGQFAFEWISGNYPVSISIDSELKESNGTSLNFLVPLFPAPPPPMNISNVKNLNTSISAPGITTVLLPYRSAPVIRGEIWGDVDGNAQRGLDETGFSQTKLFLDQDGNFQLDENETSFSPDSNGSFAFPAPPGQYSLCILPNNPDANVTFPIEEKKAYLTWVDYESPSNPLVFGIQDNSSEDQQQPSENNQSQPSQPQEGSDETEPSKENTEQRESTTAEQVNALYERLLQEMESKSQNLDGKPKNLIGTSTSGRDY